MQEVVQYEASYGSLFPVVILVAAPIYVYTNISFVTNENRLKLNYYRLKAVGSDRQLKPSKVVRGSVKNYVS